jgi:hypothetical protein
VHDQKQGRNNNPGALDKVFHCFFVATFVEGECHVSRLHESSFVQDTKHIQTAAAGSPGQLTAACGTLPQISRRNQSKIVCLYTQHGNIIFKFPCQHFFRL